MTDVRAARVKPKGCVHLGRELNLVQAAERTGPAGSFFEAGRPRGMAAVDYVAHQGHPGQLAARRLVHSLADAGREVYIEDDGLCASYGIFGSVGSGKTHLFKYLLRQLLALRRDEPEYKFGGLILDPKAELIDEISQKVAEAGRADDLVVLNTDYLNRRKQSVNLIDCDLNPYELGELLLRAAQSAGTGTSDPFWMLALGNLLGAALQLLSLGPDVVTLRALLDTVLTVDADDEDERGAGRGERRIQHLARQWRRRLDRGEDVGHLTDGEADDARQAINQVQAFYRQEGENVATVEAILFKAFGSFQRSAYRCFSPAGQSKALAARRPTFYDRIIDEGEVVLVSLSPNEPALAKAACTLVKCLFQRSVLGRLERVAAGRLRNYTRPVLLACDEYAQVASELPGQSTGDGDFFSQARQNGCMGLMATQSVNVLQASSLKDAWRSVFSNFRAKFFMAAADNETAEEAAKLAGESDWYLTAQGTSQGKDGLATSTNRDLRERKSLPTSVLTQVLRKGDAAVLGSLDGSKRSSLRFIHVPGEFAVPEAEGGERG